ncbi:MAG: amidase [Nitrososphaerota archaeon]|nr:amidase [Nitrososphaerota archaeon]
MRIGDITVSEAVALVRRGDLDPEDLVEECLDRIRRLNSRFKAFITVFEPPVSGKGRRGALAGAPLSIKDLFHVKGYPTTAGSIALKDNLASYNSTVVERILGNSGVIVGKNNLHEFTFGITGFNPHFGTAVNPWKEGHITGGSTSGGAVSVATGMSLAAIGTDTGGSVRVPAALCGLVGYKPSYGLISRYGVIPLSWTLDTVGVITKSVTDAALLTDSLMGPDGRDASVTVPDDFGLHPLRTSNLKRAKIGVLRKHFCDRLSEVVKERFEDVLARLDSEGAKLSEVELNGVELMSVSRSIITHAEAAATFGKFLRERPDDVSKDLKERLIQGLMTPAPLYVNALRSIPKLIKEFRRAVKGLDALLLPTTMVTAPRHGENRVDVGGSSIDVRSALLKMVEPFNLIGAPSVSVPCGLSKEGLPVGVQLVGDLYTDRKVLSLAASLERLMGRMRLPEVV